MRSSDIKKQFLRPSSAVAPAGPSSSDREGTRSRTSTMQSARMAQEKTIGRRVPPQGRDFSFSYESVPTEEVPGPYCGADSYLSGTGTNGNENGDQPWEDPHSGEAEDILDYGMSVEVMEDTRREVILEIKEIKKHNKTTQEEIKRETEMEKQHKKDLGYAQREINSLYKGIDVEHEKAKTHRSFVNKLQADYNLQVALPLKQIMSPVGFTSNTHTHPITPDVGTSVEGRLGTKGGTLMEKRTQLFKELFEKLRAYENVINKGSADIEEARDMRLMVSRIIQEHGLKELLVKARSDANQFRDDYHECDKNRQTLYEVIGASKDHLAGLKRETASKRKHLKGILKDQAEWEIAQTDELVALRSELTAARAKNVEVISKIEHLQAQSNQLQSLKGEYDVYCEKKSTHKSRIDGLAQNKVDLENRKNELIGKIEAAKSLQAKAEQRHHDAEIAFDASKKLEAACDLHEKTVVVPAKKEILDIVEQKNKLLIRIKEHEEETGIVRQNHEIRKTKLEKENEELIEAIAKAEASIQEMKQSTLEMDNEHLEMRDSIEREIQEAEQRRDHLKTLFQQTKESRSAAFRSAVLMQAAAFIGEKARRFQ
ncbi:hypothetical protein IV203_035399 [Nitzschia inconspicua]|uniref:Uncharacterized protein n=1 Tax=Nitzschia inconspicua TaxID=303405 RepID=A0A9K3LEE0_9STRA|nr:hypothetical protein IV203_035399 [Nitzschia inconspicua]